MMSMKDREFYFGEVKKLIKKDIRENIKAERRCEENTYLTRCKNYLMMICSGWKDYGHRFCGKIKNEDFSYSLWVDLKPELTEYIRSVINSCKADQMKKAVNAISAQALISSAMKEAGLEYQIEAQQYRAKVSVKLNDKSKVTFYISYKKMQEMLATVVNSAKNLKEAVSDLGKGTTLGKVYSWESWE